MFKHKWGGSRSSSPRASKVKIGESEASALDHVTGQNIPSSNGTCAVQEIEPFIHLIDQLQKQSGPAKHFLLKLCQDSQDKDMRIDMQAKRIKELSDLVASMEAKISNQQEFLRQGNLMVEATKLHAEEFERKAGQLTDEKWKLEKQVAQLTEDLHASEAHVRVLTKQLKEADGMQQKAAFLVSRVHSLQEKVKHEELQRKETKESCKSHMIHSRNLSEENRKLRTKTVQLSASLEDANALLSATVSEKEKLEREVEKQKTNEEGLYRLVEEKKKKFSKLQQAYDALSQHLREAASIATVQEQEVSGDFSVDDLDFCELSSSYNSTSYAQSLPITVLHQLPSEHLPDVSTEILAPHLGHFARKWYEVAHALGVGLVATSLRQTEQDPERKCLLCLEAWIERGPEVGCSWEKLLHVLCSLQLHAIAREIRDELCGQRELAQNNSI